MIELPLGKTGGEPSVHPMKRLRLRNRGGDEPSVQHPSVRRERHVFGKPERLYELSPYEPSFPLQLQRYVQLQLVSLRRKRRLRSRISEQLHVHYFKLVQLLLGMLVRWDVRHGNPLPMQAVLLLDLRGFERLNQRELHFWRLHLVGALLPADKSV